MSNNVEVADNSNKLPGESNSVKQGMVPTWAKTSAGIFIFIGILFLVMKDQVERSGLISALKEAKVEVRRSETGLKSDYGAMFIKSNVTEFNLVLGMCYSKPTQALAIFKGLMAGGSNKEGKLLGCRIGQCLIADGKISEQERNNVLDTLVKQTDKGVDADVQSVAQSWIADLLVMTNTEQSKLFEKITIPKGEKKDDYKIETIESEGVDSKLLTIRWASPKTFQIWWKTFGSLRKWNSKLKRFVFVAGKDTAQAF